MNSPVKPGIGAFVSFADLTYDEQTLVNGSWAATEHAYTPLSKFPVGAMVHMKNARGHGRNFFGCNVETQVMSCTICAERNAITTAVASGYTRLEKIALVIKLYQGPGASPCGLCRQVLVEFGPEATVLQGADAERNVARYLVKELLPAAGGEAIRLTDNEVGERRRIARLLKLAERSHAPYSKKPGAALFTAVNERGTAKVFAGVVDDNASYGGTAAAETVAMRSARTAGFVRAPSLMLLVADPKGRNPVEGESLQVLREFGGGGEVILVGPDGTCVRTSVGELLPDSFGPESLV